MYAGRAAPRGSAIDIPLVRALLEAQHPDLAGLSLVEAGEGWDNRTFRLGEDLAVRLPRRATSADGEHRILRWSGGRLEPFVGAGLGLSALRSSLHTDVDPTVSFSVGTAVRLTERLALNGEFRLRGHEFRFVGSSTEVNAGLSWRLPNF